VIYLISPQICGAVVGVKATKCRTLSVLLIEHFTLLAFKAFKMAETLCRLGDKNKAKNATQATS
jgi:hypothetical protein